MIETIADLLSSIIAKEQGVLDEFPLTHGPTIGSMYEGLSKEILAMSLPGDLKLQVVSGFGHYNGVDTGELDCMLVTGHGEKIPHTDKYRWPIQDILAVLEIKKKMEFEDLVEGYDLLHTVSNVYTEYLKASHKKMVTTEVDRVFELMTGNAISYEQANFLPSDQQTIYHTLVVEAVEPVRVLFAYHSWKKQVSLRENVEKMVKARGPIASGMGISSFPHLIVGEKFSVIKTNGRPYLAEIKDGWWPALVSSDEDPVLTLLELIYTKLESRFDTQIFCDEDADSANVFPCFCVKPAKAGKIEGWEYRYTSVPRKLLKRT